MLAADWGLPCVRGNAHGGRRKVAIEERMGRWRRSAALARLLARLASGWRRLATPTRRNRIFPYPLPMMLHSTIHCMRLLSQRHRNTRTYSIPRPSPPWSVSRVDALVPAEQHVRFADSYLSFFALVA